MISLSVSQQQQQEQGQKQRNDGRETTQSVSAKCTTNARRRRRVKAKALSCSDHLEAQNTEENRIAALLAMSVGVSFDETSKQLCDQLQNKKKKTGHPTNRHLLAEAKRRYSSFGMAKHRCRPFKPTSGWNREQLMKWLYDHPLQSENDLEYLSFALLQACILDLEEQHFIQLSDQEAMDEAIDRENNPNGHLHDSSAFYDVMDVIESAEGAGTTTSQTLDDDATSVSGETVMSSDTPDPASPPPSDKGGDDEDEDEDDDVVSLLSKMSIATFSISNTSRTLSQRTNSSLSWRSGTLLDRRATSTMTDDDDDDDDVSCPPPIPKHRGHCLSSLAGSSRERW